MTMDKPQTSVEAARERLDSLEAERAALPGALAEAIRLGDETAVVRLRAREREIGDHILGARARWVHELQVAAEDALQASEAAFTRAVEVAVAARNSYAEHDPARVAAEDALHCARMERDTAKHAFAALRNDASALVTEATQQARAPVVRSLPHSR